MADRRCYTIAQICEELDICRATFFGLRNAGKLPFLEELRPRVGRKVRYRADLVDRYFANEFGRTIRLASRTR